MASGPHPSLPPDVEPLQDELLDWYERSHRDFPWRQTEDPYEILVSEVMSQQTQLDRIVEPWRDFVERWPDVEALAGADRADVVAFWSAHNLGYNNRAKYLHEAAKQVRDDFDGEVPGEPAALEDLQGVGPYTANAVASFAFNNGDAVVDTNVKRVLYRAFDVRDEDEVFEAVANTLVPNGHSGAWNNAIMELGGVACEKRPKCDEAGCPWRRWCSAYRSGNFEAPDIPTQEPFEGSRRQMRGRVVEALAEHGAQVLEELGPRVRVDYTSNVGQGTVEDGDEREDPETEAKPAGREWLQDLLADMESEGLVTVRESGDRVEVELAR